MKPKYLGDCLDFYKRWFLREFFPGRRLAALPMLTEPWGNANDAAVYGALLGVDVIQDQVLPNVKERLGYFDTAMHPDNSTRDLFLDPDTGLKIGKRPKDKRYDEYLFDQELTDYLLPVDSGRVAVIYDQSLARGSEVKSTSAKLHSLGSMKLWGLAYAAQAAMVIVSRDRERISMIYEHACGLAHVLPTRVLANTTEMAARLLLNKRSSGCVRS